MSSILIQDKTEKPAKSYTDSTFTRYIVAVLGAWCAEAATYPFDLAKTRIQIQNEIAAAKYGYTMEHYGLISTAIGIAKNEGPLKLYSGLTPMCQRHAIYSGTRLVLYEYFRNIFTGETGRMTFARSVLCGATCGALAALVSSPTDLVKVQMQAEGRRLLQGKEKRFNSCWEVYKMIYRETGFLGFWRGVVPNMQRAAFVNIGDLTAYDYTKRFLMVNMEMPDTTVLHVISAFTAGLVAAILGTPADVIKTRLMNQPVGDDGRGKLYRGLIDCFWQSINNEGFLAMYKGFVPMWIRLGPWTLVNWVAFEQIIQLFGGRTF